jgi:[ribosomal protein S5]-alanine N-acetyltransferase
MPLRRERATVIILQTERLTLREVVEDDAGFMLDLLNSRGFIENVADRGVRTEDRAREWIRERVWDSYEVYGFGMWIVEARAAGDAIGIAGILKREGLEHPDIGFAFLEHAWGKGYAQEIAAAVLAYALGPLRIAKVAAITMPQNHASMAVLRKIGLVRQGVIQVPDFDGESTYFVTP